MLHKTMDKLNLKLSGKLTRHKQAYLLVVLAPVTWSSLASEFYDHASLSGTRGIQLIPEATVSLQTTDNLYFQTDNTTHSNLLWFKPGVKAGWGDGLNYAWLAYQAQFKSVSQFKQDDYSDHQLQAVVKYDVHSKHKLKLLAGLSSLHQERGTGLTERNYQLIDSPLNYLFTNLSSSYKYGAESAKAMLGVGLAYSKKQYQNYQTLTTGRNFEKQKIWTDFEYDLGPVTATTFDLTTEKLNYDLADGTQINRNHRTDKFLIGIKWQGLAKTTGRLKLGWQRKIFETSQQANFYGTAVDIGLIWQPKTYSSFSFNLAKSAKDSETEGDFIKLTEWRFKWLHEWSETGATRMELTRNHQNYIGQSGRKDTDLAILAAYEFKLTRWFKADIHFNRQVHKSTSADLTFDKNLIGFTLTGGL